MRGGGSPNGGWSGDSSVAITLTERAAREIRRTFEENGIAADACLRIAAMGAGCCEYTYAMDVADAPGEEDTVVESRGIRLVCDPQSYENLRGTEADFSDDPSNRGFVFHNPNARGKHTCDEASPG